MSLALRSVILISFCFVQICGFSQEKYKRVRVDLTGKEFKKLLSLDLDVDHAKPIPGRYIDLEIPESDLKKLNSQNWKYTILEEDLASYYSNPLRSSEISLESRSGSCAETSCDSYSNLKTPTNFKLGSMNGYFTYQEMLNILDDMKRKYPHLVSERKPIGAYKTHNGNPIQWLRISNNPTQRQNKPQILYTALHHSREPMSLSQMIFFMWHLLENYEKDNIVTSIINNSELYFIPCVNPDGYLRNTTTYPNGGGMWRKNGYKNSNGLEVGVDLNRNYGFKWGYDNEGSSSNPASETFRGPSAFSEPETQAISSFVTEHNFKLCLNFHSHGNFLIHPWGHTTELNPDANLFNLLAESMTSENCYSSGTGQNTVGYMVNGDADDWMYGDVITKNRVFSFTPEIGKSFYPPKSDIIDLCKSTLRMNLTIPRIARNYSEAIPFDLPIAIHEGKQKIGFEIKKVGFLNDGVKVKLDIDKATATTGLRQAEYVSSVSPGQSDTIYFEFRVNRDVVDGEKIVFNYTVLYDEIEEKKSFELPYFKNLPTHTNTDNFEASTDWITTGDWGRTSLLYSSGRFSLTDSPGALYRANSNNYATMPGYIDLSEASGAILKYKARWYIEENFDNAQVQISTDGLNFRPLCGKYTRINAFDQIVYDGFQDSWVDEEISLQDYIGSPKVYIRFALTADQLSQFDGIYIDDFYIEIVSKSILSSVDTEKLDILIYPNPVVDNLQIVSERSFKNYKIYNSFGQLIDKGIVKEKLAIKEIDKGIYILELIDSFGNIDIQRFIKN
jgi:carboxypeptidase T